jgi:alpha-mannosidase
LATGVNGNQPDQTFTVTYTDGTTQTFTQSLSDWFTPQGFSGESVAATMPYRNTADGGMDNRDFNVFDYSLALDSSKTLQSIMLPDNANVQLLAITLV